MRVLRKVTRRRGRPTDDCVLIAPEGTRSTTGQLLPFKKGPFYIWEDLHVPIVPLVVFGAFELFPRGQSMNSCGRVVVQVLPPLICGSGTPALAGSGTRGANDRERMSHRLRDVMLQALAKPPTQALEPESSAAKWWRTGRAYSLLLLLLLADWRLFHALLYALHTAAGLSPTAALLALSGFSVAVTVAVYTSTVLL